MPIDHGVSREIMTLPDAKCPMLRLVNGYTLAFSRPRPPSRFCKCKMTISKVTLYGQENNHSSSFHSKTSIFLLGNMSCTDGLGSMLSGHSFPGTTYVVLVSCSLSALMSFTIPGVGAGVELTRLLPVALVNFCCAFTKSRNSRPGLLSIEDEEMSFL